MAASPTPRPTPARPSGNPALAALQRAVPRLPVGVAFSGGADSTALLIAAHEIWPGRVHAIHVHHGLQPGADDFERRCQAVCDERGVPFHTTRIRAAHGAGESPEDAARKGRYAALAQAAIGLGLHCVLLGHHADDQAETLLLALSRGAGLPGMAAMPGHFERHGMSFHRPLLDVPGRSLRDWLTTQRIEFVEDPTNADTAFTRNRIRHSVVPALEAAFPQFRETFARSARHAAQAQELLAELAARDLSEVGNPPRVAELRGFSRPRQANMLRHWLRTAHDTAASTAQMEELLDQVAACATRGHSIRMKVAAGRVELHHAALRYVTSPQDRRGGA